MRNKTGIICMIFGAVLVLSALSLFLLNWHEDQKAGEASEQIRLQLIQVIQEKGNSEGEIDGNRYIGCIYIPSLNLELPVMSEWDYDRMKLAPCRYSGSVQGNDLVIVAHNYRKHFGTLYQISEGDKVYFESIDGSIFTYTVAVIETLSPTDVEKMTDGKFNLTLFTCTYGGQSRITVRCERIDKNSFS